MKIVGLVIGWILLLPLSSIWYGFVLSVLWTWFVVPAFQVPALSIVLAIGVTMAIRMITSTPSPSGYKEDESKKKSAGLHLFDVAAYSFLYPLFALAFGAIVHAFV